MGCYVMNMFDVESAGATGKVEEARLRKRGFSFSLSSLELLFLDLEFGIIIDCAHFAATTLDVRFSLLYF